MKTPNTHFALFIIMTILLLGCNNEPAKQEKASEPSTTTSVGQDETSGQEPGKETGEKTNVVTTKTVIIDVCGNTEFDLMTNINQSVDRLEGTPYSRELKNDCSGIFHQVVDGMRGQCPKAEFPAIKNARASRDIAAWYQKNGEFKIIRNPASQGDLIKPGMVMFYGYASRASQYNYQTMTIDTLTTRGVGINHVAIVTEVNRDEAGVLQSYVIFHGKNVGKPAGETTSRISYDNHPELPVYGNWGEPWLAVARVMAPKK